jgi:hypothetical protein
MFVTKIKRLLALVLVVAALSGAAGVIYRIQAAEQPLADLPKTTTATERRDREGQAKVDVNDANAMVQQLQKQIERLRADNEELKKRLQQAVRKGKADDVKLVVKVYPVASLLLRDVELDAEGGNEAQPLMRAITKTIEPMSWSEMGGDGSIEYVRSAASIVVRQTPDNQKQVQELLEALRKNRTEQQKAEQEEQAKVGM